MIVYFKNPFKYLCRKSCASNGCLPPLEVTNARQPEMYTNPMQVCCIERRGLPRCPRQIKKIRRIMSGYNAPYHYLKPHLKTDESELTPPLRQQYWQKMLTQVYAHQRFAYAKGPYKDPNIKHKHRGLKRGSAGIRLDFLFHISTKQKG